MVALVATGLACGKSPTSPSNPGGGTPPGGGGNPVGTGTGILIGAGDIASCDNATWTPSAGTVGTAKLLDTLTGTVFTAGDNAYFDGNSTEYSKCYDPYWGRHKSRTKPVPGNHDYQTAGAFGYYSYFGDEFRGPDGWGYYSYRSGTWTIIVLNSELLSSGQSPSAGAAAQQLQWLRTQSGASSTPCTLAIWHRPRFSSGPNGDNPDTQELWQALYDLKADVIVNGHDHLYERFGPQDPAGWPDSTNGIQQFTVGTGGASLYDPQGAKFNSQVRIKSFGVARFTLLENSYSWEFIPIDATGSTDSGTRACH